LEPPWVREVKKQPLDPREHLLYNRTMLLARHAENQLHSFGRLHSGDDDHARQRPAQYCGQIAGSAGRECFLDALLLSRFGVHYLG
jgi:hypothetical protein